MSWALQFKTEYFNILQTILNYFNNYVELQGLLVVLSFALLAIEFQCFQKKIYFSQMVFRFDQFGVDRAREIIFFIIYQRDNF